MGTIALTPAMILDWCCTLVCWNTSFMTKYLNTLTGWRSGYVDHTTEYSLIQHNEQSTFFASNTKRHSPHLPWHQHWAWMSTPSRPFFCFKCLPTLVFYRLPVCLLLRPLLPSTHLQYHQRCPRINLLNHLHLHLFHHWHNSSAFCCMRKPISRSAMHPNMRMNLIFEALGQTSLWICPNTFYPRLGSRLATSFIWRKLVLHGGTDRMQSGSGAAHHRHRAHWTVSLWSNLWRKRLHIRDTTMMVAGGIFQDHRWWTVILTLLQTMIYFTSARHKTSGFQFRRDSLLSRRQMRTLEMTLSCIR